MYYALNTSYNIFVQLDTQMQTIHFYLIYEEGTCNITEENSSIFSLIHMDWLPLAKAKLCSNKMVVS